MSPYTYTPQASPIKARICCDLWIHLASWIQDAGWWHNCENLLHANDIVSVVIVVLMHICGVSYFLFVRVFTQVWGSRMTMVLSIAQPFTHPTPLNRSLHWGAKWPSSRYNTHTDITRFDYDIYSSLVLHITKCVKEGSRSRASVEKVWIIVNISCNLVFGL